MSARYRPYSLNIKDERQDRAEDNHLSRNVHLPTDSEHDLVQLRLMVARTFMSKKVYLFHRTQGPTTPRGWPIVIDVSSWQEINVDRTLVNAYHSACVSVRSTMESS
jgi:hypothetical protein